MSGLPMFDDGYGEDHKRHALGDLARDICLHMELCRCGEKMEYLPAHKAEPDTGAAAWPGGFVCHGCGAERPDNMPDEDDAWDARCLREWRDGRDAA